MSMRPLSTFLRDGAGAAAVELALVLPLALVLIFTASEAAYFIWNQHKVVKGVRDAARYAGRLDFSNFDCTTNSFSGNSSAVKNLARTGQLSGGTTVVPGWADSNITISISCLPGQQGLYGTVAGNAPRVTVSTRFAYQPLYGAFGFATGTVYLGAAAQSPVVGL
jgi:Flp pilus assembly protein TadG